MLEPTECGQSTGYCKLNSCVLAGVHKTSQEAAQCNMSYIMSRKDLSR